MFSKSFTKKRAALRNLLESQKESLIPFINACEFPHHILEPLKKLEVSGFDTPKEYGGQAFSNFEMGALAFEFGRVDGSLTAFFMVQNAIGVSTIYNLSNDEQKARILPEVVNMNKICSFALTEPDYGSDATSLKTTARKVEGGFVLNGEKRWIGNATWGDYVIVWARNEDEGGKIQGFLVTTSSVGYSTTRIDNKYSVRMVINANIFLKDVFVPDNMRLAKATDFQKGTNKILESSRLTVTWGAAGTAVGAYEAALKYCLERKQFGKPIA